MMTREQLVALPLTLVSNFTGEFEAVKTMRNEEHGITMVTVTKRMGEKWGEGRKEFYLDGVSGKFDTTDALLDAVNTNAR